MFFIFIEISLAKLQNPTQFFLTANDTDYSFTIITAH
jgi:hypothetical protein